jgi:hypothetical protein
MQQRYYDPIAARFLSVDPIVTDAYTGAAFARYMYASNNPYKYTDPDGRADSIIDETHLGRGIAEPVGVPRGMDGGPVRTSIDGARANLAEVRAQLKVNAAQGKAGEMQVKAEMGKDASGAQVTFRTSDGSKTVVDITKGTTGAVEVKTGNAQLTTNQGKMKADVQAGRAVTPVGENAKNAGFEPGKPIQLQTYEVKRHIPK